MPTVAMDVLVHLSNTKMSSFPYRTTGGAFEVASPDSEDKDEKAECLCFSSGASISSFFKALRSANKKDLIKVAIDMVIPVRLRVIPGGRFNPLDCAIACGRIGTPGTTAWNAAAPSSRVKTLMIRDSPIISRRFDMST
ncbi:MAG: hypothetical protein JXR29_02315 [Methylothermaceae bacterium]|nr:hypothetical protein [Methylothermaceae bacterium]